MGSLIFPSVSIPLTSLSLVSVSISPDEKYINPKLENLNDIYKNTIFSQSFTTLDNYTTTTTNNNNVLIESRQGSKTSLESNYSNSNSNLTITNLSPSLKSAYLSKRAFSFRRQRSITNSFDDNFNNNTTNNNRGNSFIYSSKRSSITSISSFDCNDNKHPLFIPESVIDDDDIFPDDQLNLHDELNLINNNNSNNNYDTNQYYTNDNINSYSNYNNNNKQTLLSFLKKMHNSIQIPKFTLNLNVKEEVPLETFSQKFEFLPNYNENININLNQIDSENFYTLQLSGKTRRIREYRINPDYLLQYALDTSIRNKGFLDQISNDEIDIFDNLLLEKYSELSELIDFPLNDQIFDDVFNWKLKSELESLNYNKLIDDNFINILKLSSISRFKLSSNITLPPRLDNLPNINSIIDNIYISPSLNSCHVPWLNIKDLKSGKGINRLTKSAGLLKGSNIQYVSKKCVSKRWVCSNNNNNNNNNN